MRKIFRAKRRGNNRFFLWIILVVTTFLINNKVLTKISKSYLIDGNLSNLVNVRINADKLLLNLGFNYREKKKEEETSIPTFEEVEYQNPRIYVYNTHQSEEYKDGDVLDAANYLKELLEKGNIDVVVEETNITKEISKRNLTYRDSYKITRELLEKNINDQVALYIDLHRDSSSYDISTVKLNDISYARMMFVVGGKHESYKSNYAIANELNKRLKNWNNKISRGIYVRKTSSYNQDLNTNAILIEVGGPHNSLEEVKNSLKVLSDVIVEYIGE